MLSVKQGGIMHHFLRLWYDSTWDWTPNTVEIKQINQIKPLYLYGPGDWSSIPVESYQRLKKLFLILFCLTLSLMRYVSVCSYQFTLLFISRSLFLSFFLSFFFFSFFLSLFSHPLSVLSFFIYPTLSGYTIYLSIYLSNWLSQSFQTSIYI